MQPSIGILLRELTRLYNQAQREHVTSGHDTSSTQNHVLMELGRTGLLTQHELGRRLSLDKGWVSRAVESLVQAGLVAKSRQDNDRRNRWLQLTSKGQARYQTLNEALDTHAEQLMQPLSHEQRSVVHHGLQLLLNSLQGTVDAASEEQEVTEQVACIEEASKPTAEAVAGEEELAVAAETCAPVAAQMELASPATTAEATTPPEPSALSEPTVLPEPSARTEPSAHPEPVRHAESNVQQENKARPVHSASASRILGSRTLPTRPLLSRTPPRTPLSRAAQSAENKTEDSSPRLPGSRVPGHVEQPHPAGRPASALPSIPPRTLAQPTSRPLTSQTPLRVSPAKPVVTPAHPAEPAPSRPHPSHQQGSIFQKILSQGSLFNKLLQRDQPQEETPLEAPPPAETEPDDGLQFQPASQSDWNEIRNLLTANRLQVQGALNHLNNFVVATENGRVVGAIGMEVYGDIGLIRSLVVASNMRGRKVARRLVKQLIARAHTRQVGALYLLSGPADNLFASFGFEKMARADMPTKLYVSSEMQGSSSTSPTGMRLIL